MFAKAAGDVSRPAETLSRMINRGGSRTSEAQLCARTIHAFAINLRFRIAGI